MRHDRFLHEIIKGRMRGEPTRERIQMLLHDLANDDGFIALKLAADDREGLFVCLFAWGLTALSAQIGYIAP